MRGGPLGCGPQESDLHHTTPKDGPTSQRRTARVPSPVFHSHHRMDKVYNGWYNDLEMVKDGTQMVKTYARVRPEADIYKPN